MQGLVCGSNIYQQLVTVMRLSSQQTDHFTAFASSQDIKLNSPMYETLYMHHLIRCLEGDEANDTFLILQRQKHKFKEVT